jgi:hypothetical protein
MNLEQKYTEMMERFKREALETVSKAIDTVHCDLAPHLESDTDANVSHQAGQLIDAILRGNFERRDDYSVWVSGISGVSTLIRMTDTEYDHVRKNLLSVMPACPKDIEIKSLKEQLARAYDRHF